MKACIFSFTRNGANLSINVKKRLMDSGYTVDCFTVKSFVSLSKELRALEGDLDIITAQAFARCSALIFIGSSGIAVRKIAPFIKDKASDPAVICIDEKGEFVIPLLSGHIGGANSLARVIAEWLGACPVITTATDVNGLFAVDEWAKKNNMYICDLKTVKRISADLLNDTPIGLYSDFELQGELPPNVLLNSDCESGIAITLEEQKKPFATTLKLIPKIICLGIGCKKDVSCERIEELVLDILENKRISINSISDIATIDLKKDEKGLLDLAEKYSIPLSFYSAEELGRVSGKFSESDFVKSITGIDNVCERAAVIKSDKGKLLVKKTAKNGVTVALAQTSWRVNFEYSNGWDRL
ncbi:MAG: cobalt-precorrin 5A hydrolase [Eubacteriales bacterium]